MFLDSPFKKKATPLKKLLFSFSTKILFLACGLTILTAIIIGDFYHTKVEEVILHAPVEDFHTVTARLRLYGFFVTGVLIVLAIAGAFFLAHLLRTPLKTMITEIEQYGAGEKELQLPVSRQDEIGELAVAFQDLTQKLEHSKEAERQTKIRLQAIMDNTVDGLITITSDGTIQSYNKACETIFGYTADEAIGQNVKILMPEPYHSEHDGYLKNYRETGVKRIIGIGREVMGRRKDGCTFDVDLSVSEISFEGRRFFSGIVRDITERKQAETEIIRSNEELERFAYIASHDLQEPLRMIRNFTDLLREEYEDKFNQEALEYMRYITNASTRMQDLISDLLEYSRLNFEETGLKDFDSRVQVEIALDNFSETIRQTECQIDVGPMPEVEANPMRFSRLMQNLIGNALKYRAKNRPPVITIRAEEQDDEWLFSVQDNGIGIKQEYLEQIFIIFKRLHGKKDYAGTGIGLAICKKIVDSFNGRIWAESEPGQGSTFYFTLPKPNSIRNAA